MQIILPTYARILLERRPSGPPPHRSALASHRAGLALAVSMKEARVSRALVSLLTLPQRKNGFSVTCQATQRVSLRPESRVTRVMVSCAVSLDMEARTCQDVVRYGPESAGER